MNGDQLTVFIILAVTLILFASNRWRYDIVALLALLASELAGVVTPEQLFMGLGHPAVVTVAAVLVLSRGLRNAGVVDIVARQLTRVGNRPWIQVATLSGVVAGCSGFMNNVGALALFMPVAIWMSRRSGNSPSLLLMPLAFGSLLGGTLTMIGTPPNIIISSYREQATTQPFEMFDFLPVGLGVTVSGILFIAVGGWRLIPLRKQQDAPEELFEISAYLTELRVPEKCRFSGRTLHELAFAVKDDAEIMVTGLVRSGHLEQLPSYYKILQAQDILLVEADSDSLKTLLDVTGLELAEQVDDHGEKTNVMRGDLTLMETIVTPESILVGSTAVRLNLREIYSLNILAVARQGRRLRERIGKLRFVAGDILLVQGTEDSLSTAMKTLGCLPLASRGLLIAMPRRALLASAIFVLAVAVTAFDLVPPATALVGGALVMVLAGLLSADDAYKSIDVTVIVLLAAMLPIGQALESTGGSQLIADGLLKLGRSTMPAVTLAVLMSTVMLLSNVVNNAAAAVLAAPVAIHLADAMNSSVDPFLMAVAIGSSCAFLTPIGHQSNTLVMAPGGYEFGDYWRMGLPLSVLVVATAVPMILWWWPL